MPRGVRYTTSENDRKVLVVALSLGLTVHEIADRIGVPERTLRRHYAAVFARAELKAGRPAYQPTPELRKFVRLAASTGTPHAEIAPVVGCSKGTLEKHFARELKLGKAEANLRVGEQLYKAAMGDPKLASTVMAAIFWAKCQMGWRETGRVDSSFEAIGGATPVGQVVVLRPQDAAESRRDQPPCS